MHIFIKIRFEGRSAGPHPVDVATQGIDLSVVGQHPERLGEIPAWKGVGRKTGVHQNHG